MSTKETNKTSVTVNEEVSSVILDLQKEKLRNLISGYYDIQKLRISTGNRIVQSFNIQMGQKPSTSQEDMEKEAQSMISTLRKEFSRITDAYTYGSYVIKRKKGSGGEEKVIEVTKSKSIKNIIEQLNANEDSEIVLIKNKMDYDLMSTYIDLLDTEDNTQKIIAKEVAKHPLWDAFFADVKGCGPLMAAVCIAYFDIHKARHVSSFWKYAGLDTVAVEKEDGTIVREGRAKKHTEMYEYRAKDGTIKEKRGLTYNPTLKTKLVGVLGPCFLKKPGCKYEQIYRDYHNRLDNRKDADQLTDAHKFRRSIRYMIKQFVRDLWVVWRAMEGYEVSQPYEVAKLGYTPHKYNEFHDRVAHETRK